MSHSSRTNAPVSSPTPQRGMLARYRWPMLAALSVVVLTGAIFALRKPVQEKASPKAATAPSDSIVTLDSTARRLAAIEIGVAGTGTGDGLVANGAITYDANRVSVVASRVDARIRSVAADLGQTVAAGTTLATLESSDVGLIRGDLERARSNADIARRNYEREKRLYEEQITPQKEMLDAEAAFRSAEADLRSAQARLNAIGASLNGEGAVFGVSSPISGVVVERNASPGQSVGSSSNLFTVADLQNLWITVDVYEADLSHVRLGAPARITPSAFPNQQFTGRVTYAGGVVDTASHTFKVRVDVPNADRVLRPGMFAQVRIQAAAGAASDASPSIPEIAVQDVNGKSVVFVATADSSRFITRNVTVGQHAAGFATITAGLRAGERIVTKGAFQIKAELMKASFGEED